MIEIPETVTMVSNDELVRELTNPTARLNVALIIGPAALADSTLSNLAAQLRVEQRWFAKGSERLVLESGIEIRYTTRGGLRAQSADLVVIADFDYMTDEALNDARRVVNARGGRIFAL